jgi:hypothetical protein
MSNHVLTLPRLELRMSQLPRKHPQSQPSATIAYLYEPILALQRQSPLLHKEWRLAAHFRRGQCHDRVRVRAAFRAIIHVHDHPVRLAQRMNDHHSAQLCRGQHHDRPYETRGPHPLGAMVEEATHLVAGRGREGGVIHAVPRQKMGRLRLEVQR